MLSTRLLPLSISPLPYNNDSITESRIASDILEAGHLEYPETSFYYDTHSTITPLFDVILAFVAGAVGSTPFDISQSVIAMISLLTIVGVYVIALRISRNRTGALAATMFASLFGTFIFLTGSAWKESMGVALLVLLIYSYMSRRDRKYLMVELAVLAILPLTHHLVAVIAYLMLAYLTSWSVIVSILQKKLGKTQIIDLMIIVTLSIVSYTYYSATSLSRLSYLDSISDAIVIGLLFAGLFAAMLVVLTRKSHAKITFASIPAVFLMAFVVWDYFDPIFPYAQGFSSNVLILGLVSSFIVGIAWFGFEIIIESKSEFRTIPIGALLPVLTLLAYAVMTSDSLSGHKMMYRTFDFADITLAIGISITVAHFRDKLKLRAIIVLVLLIALLITLPFAYYTNTLLGMRHDTQEYEVDALTWIDYHASNDQFIRSDERISYVARAIYDMNKDPYLPSIMLEGRLSASNCLNIFLEEWTTSGVNDYPRGYVVIDAEYADAILCASNLLYVGGPVSDNILVFQCSDVAYDHLSLDL